MQQYFPRKMVRLHTFHTLKVFAYSWMGENIKYKIQDTHDLNIIERRMLVSNSTNSNTISNFIISKVFLWKKHFVTPAHTSSLRHFVTKCNPAKPNLIQPKFLSHWKGVKTNLEFSKKSKWVSKSQKQKSSGVWNCWLENKTSLLQELYENDFATNKEKQSSGGVL